jgi:endo-1,3-1,4-beta-glycanase ExoK
MIRRGAILVTLGLSTIISAQAMGMASAELYTTQPYTYGRFEARIQHAAGDGVVSSFFLWKNGSEVAGAYWNEIDFEKVGASCGMTTNARYGTTAANHSQTNTMPGNSCAEYHTYGIEWTPSYIAWSVDGGEFRRDTGDTANAFSQNASAGMTIHFNIWPGNASFGGNINNTTLPVHEYLSWVQYASYDNGNFNVQWRQEFQDTGIPSGWAVGNWSSAYNLSTHNPQNVSFVDGIAVLSLTADDATGNPGIPPADDGTSGGVGATGGASGLPTSAGGASGVHGNSSGGCSVVPGSRRVGLGLLSILMAAFLPGLGAWQRQRGSRRGSHHARKQ